jgi:hypothetical protein
MFTHKKGRQTVITDKYDHFKGKVIYQNIEPNTEVTAIEVPVKAKPADHADPDFAATNAVQKKTRSTKAIGRMHKQAKMLADALHEYSMTIGEALAYHQKQFKKKSRHEKGDGFRKWLEENKTELGMHFTTAYKYIKYFETGGNPEVTCSVSIQVENAQTLIEQGFDKQIKLPIGEEWLETKEELLKDENLAPEPEPKSVEPEDEETKEIVKHWKKKWKQSASETKSRLIKKGDEAYKAEEK